MARNEPSGPEIDVSEPESMAALYRRVAGTLERSADLAEQHAARLTGMGRDHLARVELERAGRARAAARRGREIAARML